MLFEVMQENGIIVPPQHVTTTEASIQKDSESAKQIFSMKEKVTAIFACNDLLAIKRYASRKGTQN